MNPDGTEWTESVRLTNRLVQDRLRLGRWRRESIVNRKLLPAVVPCLATPDTEPNHTQGRAMETFDSLLQKARMAAIDSLGLPSQFDGTGIFDELLDGASDAIAAILPDPEELDVEWVTTMITARPALLKMDGIGETAGQVLVVAIADLLLNELEDELREQAREKGFDIPNGIAP